METASRCIRLIVKNYRKIPTKLSNALNVLWSKCDANCMLENPIFNELTTNYEMIDVHLRFIQVFGESMNALSGLKLKGIQKTGNPLIDSLEDKRVLIPNIASLSYAKGADFLGDKFFELPKSIDIPSLVAGYVEASKKHQSHFNRHLL